MMQPHYRFHRGILQQSLQRYSEAIADFRRAEALDHELPCGPQVPYAFAILSCMIVYKRHGGRAEGCTACSGDC